MRSVRRGRCEIDRHDITIDPPIRQTGTYVIPVEVVAGVVAQVKTIVSPLLDGES